VGKTLVSLVASSSASQKLLLPYGPTDPSAASSSLEVLSSGLDADLPHLASHVLTLP